MRKTFLSALLASILLGTSSLGPAQAQETGLNTVLTVSVSGFDAIRKDLQSLAQATGDPQLMLPLMALGPRGPAGLDTTKPWGVVGRTDGQKSYFYAFLPVTDLQKLLPALAPLVGVPVDVGGGVLKGAIRETQPVYFKGQGGWVFIATSTDALANTPEDPAALLGGLHESYLVAVRATMKNVPASMREQVLKQLRAGAEMGQRRLPKETAQQHALRRRMAARSLEEFTQLLNDTDSVQIGLAVEPQAKALRLDLEMTAIEGTSTAAEYASAGEARSDFAGFYLPEAGLTALFAGTMPENDAARLQHAIDAYGSGALDDLDEQDLSDAERQLAKQVIGDLIAVVRKTVESRHLDVGLAVLVSADSLNLVGGGFVADTATLEKLFKQMVQLAIAADPGVEQAITLDAEEHQGVRLHTLSVPADQLPGDDLPAMLVGDTLTAAVGFSDQNVYLAVGPESLDQLKRAIDQSKAAAGQPAPPLRFSLSATGVGRVIEETGGAEELNLPRDLIGALRQAGPNDRMTWVSEAIPNGMRTRLELEPGVLKLIGPVVGALMRQFGSGVGGLPGAGGFPAQPGSVPAQPKF